MSDISKRVNLLVDLGLISEEDGLFALDYAEKTAPKPTAELAKDFNAAPLQRFLDAVKVGAKFTTAEVLGHLNMDQRRRRAAGFVMKTHPRVRHLEGQTRNGLFLYTVIGGDLPAA